MNSNAFANFIYSIVFKSFLLSSNCLMILQLFTLIICCAWILLITFPVTYDQMLNSRCHPLLSLPFSFFHSSFFISCLSFKLGLSVIWLFQLNIHDAFTSFFFFNLSLPPTHSSSHHMQVAFYSDSKRHFEIIFLPTFVPSDIDGDESLAHSLAN